MRGAPPPLHRSKQVTWLPAKDLFSCCWRTNSQISFYRAKGLYSRPIRGAPEQNVFASPSNTNIIGWFYVSEALHAKNFGTRRRILRHLKTDDNVKCGTTLGDLILRYVFISYRSDNSKSRDSIREAAFARGIFTRQLNRIICQRFFDDSIFCVLREEAPLYV